MVWLLLWRRLLPDPLHLLSQQQEKLPALYMAGEDVTTSALHNNSNLDLSTKILCLFGVQRSLHCVCFGFFTLLYDKMQFYHTIILGPPCNTR